MTFSFLCVCELPFCSCRISHVEIDDVNSRRASVGQTGALINTVDMIPSSEFQLCHLFGHRTDSGTI